MADCRGIGSSFDSEMAFKYKMSSMQAALGLAQLEWIEELVDRKREIFVWYAEALADAEGITLNSEAPGTKNTYWMVTVILDPAYNLRKEQLMERLEERRIDGRLFFCPLSLIPAYAESSQAHAARQRNRTSHRLSPYGINLPSGMFLTRENVHYVAKTLRGILGRR